MTTHDESWLLPVLEYEGKSVEPLRRLSERTEPTSARLAALVELAGTGEPHTEVAALWLFKHWVINGAKAEAAVCERMLNLLHREEAPLAPNASLLLLQVLPHLPAPLPEPARLFQVLKRLATARLTFLRAWAYNSLALVAHQHPAFQEEANFWLMRAEETESASIRARIRKARAGKFKA